jgi:hypothetical protein
MKRGMAFEMFDMASPAIGVALSGQTLPRG